MINKIKKEKAFTIIELLVVIAIIAILLSIIMPSLHKAKQIAQRVVCAAHQRSFGTAFHSYVNDYNGRSHWGPNRGYWYVQGAENKMADKDASAAYWGIAYYPYAPNMNIFSCSSSKYKLQTWDSTDEVEIYKYAHFGLNGFASNRIISRVKSPGTMIVLHDSFEQKLDNNGDMLHIVASRGEYNITQWRNHDEYPEAVVEYFRHCRSSTQVSEEEPYSPKGTGYSNTLWLDGHVSPIKQTTGKDIHYSWYTGGVGDGTQSAWVGNSAEEAYKKTF